MNKPGNIVRKIFWLESALATETWFRSDSGHYICVLCVGFERTISWVKLWHKSVVFDWAEGKRLTLRQLPKMTSFMGMLWQCGQSTIHMKCAVDIVSDSLKYVGAGVHTYMHTCLQTDRETNKYIQREIQARMVIHSHMYTNLCKHNIRTCWRTHAHGPLDRYAKLRIANAPRMQGKYSPPPRVSDSDEHHGTCMTQVSWCMPGSLTSGFLGSRCRGKRSRHMRRKRSRHMRNPQFYVSGKRPIRWIPKISIRFELCYCVASTVIIHIPQWPLLLTWFNFNPSMDM